MVHIMEDHTVPHDVFHCLQKANIKQHGSIKGLISSLRKKKKTVVDMGVDFKSLLVCGCVRLWRQNIIFIYIIS